MSSKDNESEVKAAQVVRFVTGRRIEPYDRCSECGKFHDESTSRNGRYDIHQGEDGALEVTLATSSVAERNERSWAPYANPYPASALRARWHVTVSSAARVNSVRGKKRNRYSKGFLESVVPALADLEQRGVSELSGESACFSNPFHDPACPYGVLRQAGVQFAAAETGTRETGSISVSVLFAYKDMPSRDKDKERKEEEKRQRKKQSQGGEKGARERVVADSSHLGQVLWSHNPSFISHLESRRAEDEQKETKFLRSLLAGQIPDSEIIERARHAVDERIRLARTITWRERIPQMPRKKEADAGTMLDDLLEVEFSLHSDLTEKLLSSHPCRVRREVFFWLTSKRHSAWNRLARHSLVPDRDLKLPNGVTGVWVGYLSDLTHVLHWDEEVGWVRHVLMDFLPMPICRR